MMHNKVHIAKLRSCCDVWCAGMPVQGKWSFPEPPSSAADILQHLTSYHIASQLVITSVCAAMVPLKFD